MNRIVLASLAVTLFAAGCAAEPTATETSTAAVSSDLVQTVATASGDVLADMRGLSLYTFDEDTTSDSTCYDACQTAWPPFLTLEEELPAPFGVSVRKSGDIQVTLDGHPLYFFFRDAQRGDVKGDGLGGVWHVARPEQLVSR